jgi:hypothetical protein
LGDELNCATRLVGEWSLSNGNTSVSFEHWQYVSAFGGRHVFGGVHMKKKPLAVVSLVLIATLFAVPVRPSGDIEDLFNFLLGGTREEQLRQVKSPDGRCVAILFHRHKFGPFGPPEPPKTLERSARLQVLRDGKIIYESGYDNLNIYQMQPGFALDATWSPDSNHLAYRHITSFRIVGPDGKATAYDVVPEKSAISSFKWIDNERLLVVSKRTGYPLDIHGKPYFYSGYTDHAEDIRITQLDLHKGKTERYVQPLTEVKGSTERSEQAAKTQRTSKHSVQDRKEQVLKKYRRSLNMPTFLFHAIDFCMDEISPKADRVAFSDGGNLCVYDDSTGKLVAQIKIPQKPAPQPDPKITSAHGGEGEVGKILASRPAQIEGMWWQNNDRVLIGVGLLSSAPARYAFYTYDIPSKVLTDESSVLLPLWLGSNKTRNYQEPDWFRSVIK